MMPLEHEPKDVSLPARESVWNRIHYTLLLTTNCQEDKHAHTHTHTYTHTLQHLITNQSGIDSQHSGDVLFNLCLEERLQVNVRWSMCSTFISSSLEELHISPFL